MGINNRTRLQPDALTKGWASTELETADLGGVYESLDGKVYRLVELNMDPDGDDDVTSVAQYDACSYVCDDVTKGYSVTTDLSDGDAGLFAGAIQSTTSPGQDGRLFIQTRGLGRINTDVSVSTIDCGDAYILSDYGVLDIEASASNDVAAKAAKSQTGQSTGISARFAYILGIV